MNAVRLHRTGGPGVLKLEEVSDPRPGRGEFLVEIHAGSVNPVDTKIRSGRFPLFRPRLPAIIGRDIAGVIRALGPGTRGFAIGDPVFGMIDYERGAYAEATVASARELAHRPASLSPAIAGVLGIAAQTAWQGLFTHGKLRRGQRVLIHGGAGGVGHLAVQFAKHAGAVVTVTAGRRDFGFLRRLGADRVIDYAGEPFENQTGNMDLVFDLVGGDTLERSWQVLKDRGGAIVSTLAQPSRAEARTHRARAVQMVVAANRKHLDAIARLIVARQVRVHIARTFSLAQASRAHAEMESGHVQGKIALRIA